MRVLFGMRDLPVFFVVCANPEPIGLAIKHRYGLESDVGDYEARRILEKFVDSYEDLSSAEALGSVVQAMWDKNSLPWVIRSDAASANPKFEEDTVRNATAYDAITTSVPLFSNLRALHKSYEYVQENARVNRHLLWTKWLLEIANQIDPKFRRDIRTLAKPIERTAAEAYKSLGAVTYRVRQRLARPMFEFETDKGNTLFSIFRSLFWEHAREALDDLQTSKDPEDIAQSRALGTLLSEPLRVDAVILLSLLPFESLRRLDELRAGDSGKLPDFHNEDSNVIFEFGCELAS